MTHPIIIIGAGLAGYQLAREYRKINASHPLLVVTADEGYFYSKPQLSTALTSGKTAKTLPNATADAMSAQLNMIVLTQSQVTAVCPSAKTLSVGSRLFSYDKLIFACGADVIKAPLQGNATNDLLSINHLYHYAEFESLIQNKKHIVILGAGLIGCEFANDLSNAGYEVHVIAPAKTPLDLLLPPSVGKILQTALEKNGVHFHLDTLATEINKSSVGYQLLLSTGKTIETEFVLSAIGLRPHIELAKMAGIQTERGIVVNRYLETSASDVYALGDCAEVEGHVLPYITPLLNGSRALAKTLAGERTAVEYPAMPIAVKTPVHPIVICPPPRNREGKWEMDIQEGGIRALFLNEKNELYGFILTNQLVKERMSLSRQIPPLF